jgi:3-oxoacyl-[acyl-carrier protein] reductase
MLTDKNAVIYGGAGLLGAATALAFAREGAKVFLAGRTKSKLDEVAERIVAAGGAAETAEVDALDEAAVEAHAAAVHAQGGIDVAFNAIGIRGELQGTSILEVSTEDYSAPISVGTTAHFLTARAAGRHMAERGSGVLLLLTATATWSMAALRTPIPMGGFGVACAAIEGLTRTLASELGPRGVRAACLRAEGVRELLDTVEDPGPERYADVRESGETLASSLRSTIEESNLLRRVPRAADVANTAAFLASDGAASITGGVVDVSCGGVV